MDISDCELCVWMGYDSCESREVCMLNGERPIGEVEMCDPNVLSYNQELLVIEGRRDK